MITIKQFIEQSNIPAKLIRAVIRQMGGWEEFKSHALDVCNHGAAGGFGQFIYYQDTVPFVKRNKDDILSYCAALASDSGYSGKYEFIASFNCLKDLSIDQVIEALHDKESEDYITVYNALAWYALEEVARAYCDALENVE